MQLPIPAQGGTEVGLRRVAVFAVVNAVLFRALPYSAPERLLWIMSVRPDNPMAPAEVEAEPATFVVPAGLDAEAGAGEQLADGGRRQLQRFIRHPKLPETVAVPFFRIVRRKVTSFLGSFPSHGFHQLGYRLLSAAC